MEALYRLAGGCLLAMLPRFFLGDRMCGWGSHMGVAVGCVWCRRHRRGANDAVMGEEIEAIAMGGIRSSLTVWRGSSYQAKVHWQALGSR